MQRDLRRYGSDPFNLPFHFFRIVVLCRDYECGELYMTFVFDGRFDKFFNGVEFALNVTVKLVRKSFQIDIQSIDVRQKFIGVLSDETAVGHNDGFQSGFMQQLGSVPNKLKTHSWFVIGKCNTDVSRFLPAQINC